MSLPKPSPTRPHGGAGVLRAGLAVVADAGRLVAAHWPMLLLLAIVAVVTRDLLIDLTVAVSRTSALLSRLVLSLVAFVQLATVVGMLLVMRRRHHDERPVTSFLVGTAAVMLPFLVIYEHYGYLDEDALTVGVAIASEANVVGEGVTHRLAQGTSLAVISTVVVALTLRRVLALLVRQTRPDQPTRRSALRLLAGYCEVVWVVLGATVVTSAVDGLADWWRTRRVGAGLEAWWQDVSIDLPALATAVDTLAHWASLLVGAALVAIVVPLAWLAVGTIVYGVEVRELLTAQDLASGSTGRVVGRVGDARVDRALQFLTDPERQFGGVVGAGILIARAGWAPVLVFCLAFLLADQAGLVLQELARLVVGAAEPALWQAVWPPVEMIGIVIVRVLTLALVASAVDSLLRSLGLPGGLQLRRTARGPGSAQRQREVLGRERVGGPGVGQVQHDGP